MMTNTDYYNPPDKHYLVRDDIIPYWEDDKLILCSGNSQKQNETGVNSFIIYNNDDIISVLIGYYSRHSRGQFYQHYINKIQTKWKSLSEEDKELIIHVYKLNAPSWAKIPGKMKSNYLKPSDRKIEYEDNNIIGYKYLTYKDGCYYSPRGNYKWEGDKITSDVVPSMNNDNGIYVSKKINPNILTPYSKDNVLVKIRVWGNIVEHDYTIRAEKAEILGIIK